MIIFESTFRDLLIQTNVVGQRVFLARAPQKPAPEQQSPYIVFFLVAPVNYMTQSGPLDLIERVYQVSIFDTSQNTALAIADTVRQSLNGYSGDFENVRFGGIFYEQQTFTHEPDTQLFHAIQEYRVLYRFLDTRTAVATAVTNRRRTNVIASRNT